MVMLVTVFPGTGSVRVEGGREGGRGGGREGEREGGRREGGRRKGGREGELKLVVILV